MKGQKSDKGQTDKKEDWSGDSNKIRTGLGHQEQIKDWVRVTGAGNDWLRVTETDKRIGGDRN